MTIAPGSPPNTTDLPPTEHPQRLSDRIGKGIPEIPVHWIEGAFIIMALIFFNSGTNGLEQCIPRFVVTLMRYLTLAYSLGYCCLNPGRILFTLRQNPWIVLVNLMALFSVAWSFQPEETAQRGRDLFIMLSFSFYFATRFSLRQQAVLAFYAMMVTIAMSVFFVFTKPSVGKHTSGPFDGAWRGIFSHKNTTGAYMVLAALISAAMFATGPRDKRHFYAIGIFASLAMVQLSTSKSSLIFGILSLAITWFFIQYKWQGEWTIIGMAVGSTILVMVGVTVLGDWVAIVEGLGKDPTLTGRTLIWEVAMRRLQERPILGFGRGAFYAPDSPYKIEAAYKFATNLSYVPPYSHNGYIDIMLDVGFGGFGLFLMAYLQGMKAAVLRAYDAKTPGDVFALAVMILMLLNNNTESFFMTSSNLFWVLLTTVCLSIKREETMNRAIREGEVREEMAQDYERRSLERLAALDRERGLSPDDASVARTGP
ncbi:MAG: O-antigen ligase family protein [Cyanobacteria bacterium]|nr:O-antigen ligase family protein [Cyanobacteriota bacterium]